MLHIVKLDVSTLNEIRTLVITFEYNDRTETDQFKNMHCQGVTNICDYIYTFRNWCKYFAIDDTTFNDLEVCSMDYILETVNRTGKLILNTRKKSNPEENYNDDVLKAEREFRNGATKILLNYCYGTRGGIKDMMRHWYIDDTYNNTIAKVTIKEPTPYEKQEEHIKNAKKELRLLKIEKVIFNENATIVFFEDEKKIVVKCSEMDCYSKEAAIALAYLKWDVGEEYFHYVLSALTGKKGDKVDRGRHFKPIEICDLNNDEEDK